MCAIADTRPTGLSLLQVFPREKEGTNYDLNWSLADDRVTPRGDAFRNADERTLHMYASAKPAKGSLKSALTVAKPGTL